MNKITIQNMTQQDIPLVIALGKTTPELHIEQTGEYYSQDMLESFITSPNDMYLVAKVDGVFAGYLLGLVNPYLKEAYLIDMAIKPEFRKMGIGSTFFSRAFEICAEKKCE